jgi:alkylation response protein AidB-like acyl-CoA dehydrogenase
MSMMSGEREESLRMIRESAAGLAARGGDRKRIRALRFQEPGFDRSVFREMAAQGWIGLRLPVDKGGVGLGMAEYCALAEELGAALAPEPLIPAALSAALLAAADFSGLDSVLGGEQYIVTAWQEAPSTLDVAGTSGTPRLFLPYAGGADGFLVPVRTGDTLALQFQPARGADLSLEATQDGGTFGTLRPSGGEVLRGDLGDALTNALDEAALATAAFLLGVMDQAFELTLEFLRTRQQFGKFIGSFQALQHRAADLKLQIALTRASITSAAKILDGPDSAPPARHAAVAAAKVRASEAAMLVTRQAIQLHGGIGYTDEADIGLYLRKAMTLANQFGSANVHRRRFAVYAREEEG